MLGSGLFFLDFTANFVRALLVTLIFQLCLYFFDQYDLGNDFSFHTIVSRIGQAFGVGCILLGIIYYSVPVLIISSRVFWLGYLFICVSVFCWRCAYYFILQKRLFAQKIIIVGTSGLASDIAVEVEGVQDSIYKILGFVGGQKPAFNPYNVPVRPWIEDFANLFNSHSVDRIVVALDDARGVMPIDALLKYKMEGIPVEQGLTFYERVTGKILVEKLSPSWIIFSDGFTLSRWKYQVKRLIDLQLSAFLLIVNVPVLVITAILIKLESKGPVLYSQERVGEKNQLFRVYKFRSMRPDAEKDGAVWAMKNDERVTRVGNIIRHLRIDELPQLWNVFKGEMSLVGPRPERKVFVDDLVKKIPFYGIRHEIKPGVTGWAQVCYPYGASEHDALKKLEYDLYYMKNLSITLDLLVIFKTIKTVLFQKGAR